MFEAMAIKCLCLYRQVSSNNLANIEGSREQWGAGDGERCQMQ